MNATNIDHHAIRTWLKGMGWSCCFFDDDLKFGCECIVLHPDYGEGALEITSDGADLVRPGGESGYVFRLEHLLRWFNDGSFETDAEKPFMAVRLDIAKGVIDRCLPEPAYNSSDELYQQYQEKCRPALTGALSWWQGKTHLIPDREWLDERNLAGLDRLQHSPAGVRMLRRALLRKGATL